MHILEYLQKNLPTIVGKLAKKAIPDHSSAVSCVENLHDPLGTGYQDCPCSCTEGPVFILALIFSSFSRKLLASRMDVLPGQHRDALACIDLTQ